MSENKFVVLSESHPGSWVDEESEEDKSQVSSTTAKKSAWGKVQSDSEHVPELTTIFAEESQKVEVEKSRGKEIYKPRKTIQSYGLGEAECRGRDKIAIPRDPPFTAFLGNLSYDVTNEILMDFFGELGVRSIRVITEDHKSKGFAYIEFTSREGLEKALTADRNNFYGRQLHVDVAKPPSRSLSSRSGGAHVDKDRYDSTWGHAGASKFSKPFVRGSVDRPTGERSKVNIYPTSVTPSSQLHETLSKPKGSFENPFGSTTRDYRKEDLLAQERLKKELELERREKERKEEHSKQVYKPAVESESKTASSWRSPRKEPKKIVDEEGFISRVHRHTTSSEKKPDKTTNFPIRPRINGDKSNIRERQTSPL